MKRLISTTEVRHNLGEVLDLVARGHVQYIVQRKGQPLAAIVSIHRLEQMEQFARTHLLSVLDAQSVAGITPEDADELALEAQRVVRTKSQRP